MDVKCVECGKEYLLSDNDNPESFQCECGGNLENRALNEYKQEQTARPVPSYQKTGREYSNYERRKSPLLALVLSFVIPGLGQFYNGHGEKGIIFLVVAIISVFLMFFFIGFLFYLAVWVFAMYDAFDSADRINKGKKIREKLTDY